MANLAFHKTKRLFEFYVMIIVVMKSVTDSLEFHLAKISSEACKIQKNVDIPMRRFTLCFEISSIALWEGYTPEEIEIFVDHLQFSNIRHIRRSVFLYTQPMKKGSTSLNEKTKEVKVTFIDNVNGRISVLRNVSESCILTRSCILQLQMLDFFTSNLTIHNVDGTLLIKFTSK